MKEQEKPIRGIFEDSCHERIVNINKLLGTNFTPKTLLSEIIEKIGDLWVN